MAGIVVQMRQRLVREALIEMCRSEPDLVVLGSVTTGRELLGAVAALRPSVVLTEVEGVDWDVDDLARSVMARRRTVRLVGLHERLPADVQARCRRAGFRSLVTHSSGVAGVVSALRADVGGTVAVLSERRAVRAPSFPHLTPREIEVLEQVAAGLTTHEASERLGISVKTVANHKQRLFRKLDVQNQAHAVAKAMRLGLLRTAVAKEA